MTDFDDFFRTATGQAQTEGPFPYQSRLATDPEWPARIEIPTGLGKTLAVVLAWLWRRRAENVARGSTPRRLVYCLPMRVLVEQTGGVVRAVLERLGSNVRVVVLMGGMEHEGGWDIRPEDDAVIIGTQDMLLSRALNRGYGMSRYRWPLHFGLLNNDCQWVIDEVQLMGTGVATSAQLQALRRKLGAILPTRTSWMSATLDDTWLRTVDVEDEDLRGQLRLDVSDRENRVVAQRLGAAKQVKRTECCVGELKALAGEILNEHRAGTRTLVIVNTVDRARELFELLRKSKMEATPVLLHSRFRSPDRAASLERALDTPGPAGTVVVSTQVIEAGVDVSSTTLFTEVAPWASLVQRFGRCNRRGEIADARVFWIALPAGDKERLRAERPYVLGELLKAEDALAELEDARPGALPGRSFILEPSLVLRRRDLLDLFDTTPDLMGNDVDVSRFIRDADERDVRVCWRDFVEEPEPKAPSPHREELCAAPVGVVREWLQKGRSAWTYGGLDGRWTRVEPSRIYPGMMLLLRSGDGGYDSVVGLDPRGPKLVPPIELSSAEKVEDREYDGDPESEWDQWYTLKQHSEDVAIVAGVLSEALRLPSALGAALVTAARWHDAGKAHSVWQDAARRLGNNPPAEPIAKSQAHQKSIRFGRRGFRHELASALLALQNGQSDLVCFLIACHHGKVRLSLRALPKETVPEMNPERHRTVRYARGIWEGDELPEIDLGSDVVVPPTRLTLCYMELGDDENMGPSWLSRMLSLRDNSELGPFRLGFLEALIKCADERASEEARLQPGMP